jgi:hypothetical protein
MAFKTGAKGNSREFGLNGSPGKGSKDRTSNPTRFNDNFSEIEWTGPVPFYGPRVTIKGNKLVKRYS